MGINHVGLYRDDGLSCVRSESERILDKMSKDIYKLYKKEGMSIRVKHNLVVTNFLDVTLNPSNRKFSPYCKPDKSLNHFTSMLSRTNHYLLSKSCLA